MNTLADPMTRLVEFDPDMCQDPGPEVMNMDIIW